MKALTEKEEAIMKIFWEKRPLFVKEIVEILPEPKPHVNTVSTFVRILEDKGYLTHEKLGTTYRYKPLLSETDYGKKSLRNIMMRYFNNSLSNVVSALVKDEKITDQELRDLIDMVNKDNQ